MKSVSCQSLPAQASETRSNVPILLAIGGPTATGKTSLSLALADRLNGIILSADSRQVYREFDIGTAKPTATEQARAPHYLIDVCAPTETYTVAMYQQAAQALIANIHARPGWVPLLVGGTGLYLEAVIQGLRIPPVAPQPALRSQLQNLGQQHCYDLLRHLDPAAADRIHPNDPVRTVRALEVAYVTGQPLSAQQGAVPPAYPILYLGLDCVPERLSCRIEQRTANMLERGLVQEVTTLRDRYGDQLPLLKTLGYAEILAYLQGHCSLDAATDLIVKHTRQFAKRQRTWFRKRSIIWFDADAPDLLEQVWERVQAFLERTQQASPETLP